MRYEKVRQLALVIRQTAAKYSTYERPKWWKLPLRYERSLTRYFNTTYYHFRCSFHYSLQEFKTNWFQQMCIIWITASYAKNRYNRNINFRCIGTYLYQSTWIQLDAPLHYWNERIIQTMILSFLLVAFSKEGNAFPSG